MGLRFQRIKESVMGSPGYEEPMSRRMGERTGDAAHAVGDTARTAAESVQHAPQMVADQARGNPVAAGLVAFGAGMLAATVMPRSRTEQRLVQQAQPQLQHAKEELAQAGREVATDAKEHAREAADELKSVGNEAAGHMREQAQSSARTVTEEARREQRS